MTIKYPHWEIGDRVLTKNSQYLAKVIEISPPDGNHCGRVKIRYNDNSEGWTDLHNVTTVPLPITDAERVRAACHDSFCGINQDYGAGYYAVATGNHYYPPTRDAKTPLEALDCWVMELRKREGKS